MLLWGYMLHATGDDTVLAAGDVVARRHALTRRLCCWQGCDGTAVVLEGMRCDAVLAAGAISSTVQ